MRQDAGTSLRITKKQKKHRITEQGARVVKTVRARGHSLDVLYNRPERSGPGKVTEKGRGYLKIVWYIQTVSVRIRMVAAWRIGRRSGPVIPGKRHG